MMEAAMKRAGILILTVVFLGGFAAGLAAGKTKAVDPAQYEGKNPKEACRAILETAQVMAGSGSWELLGVGRIFYLTGDKASGTALFDRVLAGKVKKDDYLRLGRIYYEAGEWEKAEAAFQKCLDMDPKDGDNLAEIGAYYNLHGNRAKAEEFFAKAFQRDLGFWPVAYIAGSYAGVKPQ
jgi:tetratricopeptide (TPR) repeat protein